VTVEQLTLLECEPDHPTARDAVRVVHLGYLCQHLANRAVLQRMQHTGVDLGRSGGLVPVSRFL
jgi:hypothetical protein